MAKNDKKANGGQWTVTVKNNPTFCGIGAGGAQFANGTAVVNSARLAQWFKEHDGYEVEAVAAQEDEKKPE